MNHLANVWVFSDNVERYAELMTGARQWGEKSLRHRARKHGDRLRESAWR